MNCVAPPLARQNTQSQPHATVAVSWSAFVLRYADARTLAYLDWDTVERIQAFAARGRTWRQRLWFDSVGPSAYLAQSCRRHLKRRPFHHPVRM